jgi:SHS2 domain-containing protein
MPHRYLEDIATADVALEAWGATMEETFVAAADATINVMVQELATVAPLTRRAVRVESEAPDLLLFALLEELVFLKDAEQLLLRVSDVHIQNTAGLWQLAAVGKGERIDPEKHALIVDVKAVTLHRFALEQTSEGWRAFVILDI